MKTGEVILVIVIVVLLLGGISIGVGRRNKNEDQQDGHTTNNQKIIYQRVENTNHDNRQVNYQQNNVAVSKNNPSGASDQPMVTLPGYENSHY